MKSFKSLFLAISLVAISTTSVQAWPNWFRRPQPIASLTVDKSTIANGESATLSWTSINGASADINGQSVAVQGSLIVAPTSTGSYTLTVSNRRQAATSAVTITVTQLPQPPPGPPVPPPPPPNIAGVQIVVVDSMANRTPDVGRLLGDVQFWQTFIDAGNTCLLLSALDPAAAKYKPQTDITGIPSLIVANSTGVLGSAKLLTDKTAVTAFINGLVPPKKGLHRSATTGLAHGLGRIHPTADDLAKRKLRKSLTQYLDERGMLLIPRAQWKSFNRRADKVFGSEFVNNQGQCSGCVGWSAAGAEMKVRHLQGFKFETLSGAFIYSQINGGRDAGAMIQDAQSCLHSKGVCLASESTSIYSWQVPASVYPSAKLRLEIESVTLDTFDEIGTAIQLGGIVQAPINVGGNFENFTSEGVAGASSGGNHSVHFYDTELLKNGEQALTMGNSWGTTWGPWGNGSCLINEAMIRGSAGGSDAFAHFGSLSLAP